MQRRLRDLRDEIYNAEGVIDGAYNSKDVDFEKFKEINSKYESILKDMNALIVMLNDVVGSN